MSCPAGISQPLPSEAVLTFPNAKINIGLNVLRKRPDGFHDISSCFYPVMLCDALEAVPSVEGSFYTSGQGISNDEPNLVSKAFDLLAADFQIPRLDVYLLKGIPIGAGLGGGSSDAAFMIKLLNQAFRLELSDGQMEDYARKLGSDCAFFIRNKPMYCYGKGDRFEDIPLSLKGRFLCLVNPGIHIPTAEAYAGIRPSETTTDLKAILARPVAEWKNVVVNDFEQSVFTRYPSIARIKSDLYEAGALYASMSGSGSSVYGIFENMPEIDNKFKNCFVWQGELS